jgi:hypothetical protein
MDDKLDLKKAVEIAEGCLEGRLTPLQTARSILGYVGVGHAAWDAMDGGYGPLSSFYVAADEADRCYFLGEDVERWHPDVRERKRAELAEAESKMAPIVQAACRALIEYANQQATWS